MTELERDLTNRLHGLADDLADGGDVAAEGAVALWRRRRRTRRTLGAVAALVAAVAIGAPAAAGQLSSAPDPGDVARPLPATISPTTPPTTAPPSASVPSRAPESAAASAALDAAQEARAQRDLAELTTELAGPVVLTSPSAWDQWLPGMKPYPGSDTADDISTCPVLSDGLSSALGQRMSYWIGTLPMGPVGCTWAPVPLQYDTIDYPFTVSVGFLGDGTTPAQLAGTAVTVVDGRPASCPSIAMPGGGMLYECWNQGTSSFELAVPDARGAGVWVLDADADDDSAVSAHDAFLALLDGVTRNYG